MTHFEAGRKLDKAIAMTSSVDVLLAILAMFCSLGRPETKGTLWISKKASEDQIADHTKPSLYGTNYTYDIFILPNICSTEPPAAWHAFHFSQ